MFFPNFVLAFIGLHWRILLPGIWSRYVPPKLRMTFSGLNSVISRCENLKSDCRNIGSHNYQISDARTLYTHVCVSEKWGYKKRSASF